MNASKPYVFKKIASAISLLFISIVNTHASDWQITAIAQGHNQVYLVPKDSIQNTGIGTKSGKIIVINRDKENSISYYPQLRGKSSFSAKDLISNPTPTKTPWDLKCFSIEIDCDSQQYHYTDDDSYYYNGVFIDTKFNSNEWHRYIENSTQGANANFICGKSTGYKIINNLKSTYIDLDQKELVILGRNILKDTENYFSYETKKPIKEERQTIFDRLFGK